MTSGRVHLRGMVLVLVALACTAATSATVGFQSGAVPLAAGASIPVAIWYPAAARESEQPLGLFTQLVALHAPVRGHNLHLVVISHGTGGTKDGHHDTALALAKAGFVVAALEHTGDNYRDGSRATDVLNRPRERHRLIEYMLAEWPEHAALNRNHVGAFGFSSGGFTVLAAAGGEPDLSLVAPHCASHPEFYDCKLVAAHGSSAVAPQATVHDGRIKALAVAAPALGFTFAHGLSAVTQPMQLWRANEDHILPAPEYADAVRGAAPVAPEFHGVPGADHYDFLAPCPEALAQAAPMICKSQAGFNRAAFHESFNKAVVGFFQANLH